MTNFKNLFLRATGYTGTQEVKATAERLDKRLKAFEAENGTAAIQDRNHAAKIAKMRKEIEGAKQAR